MIARTRPTAQHAASSKKRGLVPREHGAYAQIALPLATVLVASHPTLASALMCTAAVLAFMAHESLVIVFGGRGTRARREDGPRARRTLALLGGLAAIGGGWATLALAPMERVTIVPPLVAAIVALVAAVRLGQRSLFVQLSSSATFALAVVPIGLASGLCLRIAAIHALVWMLVFVVSTLMARTVAQRAPKKIRTAGWVLVVTSLLAALSLALGVRG